MSEPLGLRRRGRKRLLRRVARPRMRWCAYHVAMATVRAGQKIPWCDDRDCEFGRPR